MEELKLILEAMKEMTADAKLLVLIYFGKGYLKVIIFGLLVWFFGRAGIRIGESLLFIEKVAEAYDMSTPLYKREKEEILQRLTKAKEKVV